MTGGRVHPYAPTSPCDPGCLPVPEVLRGGRRARRLARLTVRSVALVAVLLAGLAVAVVLPLLGPAALGRLQTRWTGAVLAACGVRVRRRGPMAPPGALVVANHVSWLDVMALHAVAPVRMLAKREVRRWPLLGVLAASAGTVFLDRDRLRTLPDAVAGLAAALRAGATVGVFAEGTTRCGRDLGPFRPAAFQAAHDAGAPVVPVAVRYRRRGEEPVDATAAFVGDDTLASSLLRVLAARDLVVDVDVRPALDTRAVPTGPARADARRALARAAAAAITAALPADVGGHAAATRRGPEPVRRPELEHAA
ncbi:lysophospholipid acyltransferase family protein [Actinomycetospora chibensis]|uniref:Lysophospholipid acyltransferase family protein n=1 Tax=Actinomycetospora chibensis TaxID=663606 RepID=A0ABV9RGH4_9PSEU|nr:lysophospholipid acyltransferase family protein [Actinomycetospora chibensis]MDD7923630.1 lysophospholipid acyltransferase family protein [Actinomycetospora chibensis]